MNSTKILGALALLLAVPALGAQQQYGRDTNTWRWDGRVDAGRWMHVVNINGSVDFSPSTDNMVHVVAEKRSNGREMDDIHFEVVQSNGNVTICAIWNDNARCEDGGMDQIRHNDHNENHSSVKFTVKVPRSVKVGAHSVNGNVDARMSTLQGDDDMEFKTVNGSVAIYVPARFDANFRFDTVHGGIDSDFPLTITGRFGPRHASGTIGNGGRDLRASSVNGSIELHKQ
jgi:DUF4097 and DUF4098 domain-containing protein YvlB